jgi:hypothetical protein
VVLDEFSDKREVEPLLQAAVEVILWNQVFEGNVAR